MEGGKNRQSLGYTVIEVMIVLAVSGIVFVIAANFINGKQSRTAFTVGVNEMASRIQDTIEQITNGKYSDIQITCTTGGGAVNITVGGSSQGTNKDCVFLGKVIHLSESGDNSKYEVFSIAGSRLDSTGAPATTLSSAGVKAVDPILTIHQTVPQTLDITNVVINDTIPSFGVGFFQGQGTLGSGNNFKNGAQAISMYYVSGITAGMTESTAASSITGASLMPAKSADLCLTDSTRKADIRVGGSSSQLSVSVKMGSTAICP